ncbi:MAG: isopeptide-forming domain-containing fimbrial protein, partial [FCB group bacterium]|nr:isopeptide-forming domain-containing fimbrial protein [FCB group bacterium]
DDLTLGDINLTQHAAPVNTGTAADEVWVWSFNDAVNGTNADQTVILAFQVNVTNTDSDYPDNEVEYNVTNAARVTWDTTATAIGEPGDLADTDDPLLDATVDNVVAQPAIEEDPEYRKTAAGFACGVQVEGGDVVQFTFQARNTGDNRAYDLIFEDTLPPGMRSVQPANIVVRVDGAVLTLLTDYTVVWVAGTGVLTITLLETDAAQPEENELFEVDYDATVDISVGSQAVMDNAAHVESYTSFPGIPVGVEGPERTYGHTVGAGNESYVGDAICTHNTATPTVEKTIESEITAPAGELSDGTSRGTIGEVMTYRLKITIPQDTTLYDLTFDDTIPDGLTVRGVDFIYNAVTTPIGAIPLEQANGTTVFSAEPVIVAASSDFPDLAPAGGTVVTVEITCTIDQEYTGGADVLAGAVFDNDGTFNWNYEDGIPATTRSVTSLTASFTVLEPELTTLLKDVADPGRGIDDYYWYSAGPTQQVENNIYTVLPDDVLTFTVTFVNPAGANKTTAYDIIMNDVLPSGLTYVGASITATADIGGDPAITVNTVSPLNVTFGHLAAGATLTVTYQTTVDQGLGAGRFLQNSVSLTDYSTLPTTATYEASERNTATTPGYSDLGPISDEGVGVQHPTIVKNVYRLIGDPGGGAIKEEITNGDVRLGEVLQYEITVTLKQYTALLEGVDAGHVLFRDTLPGGFKRIAANDDLTLGDINLTQHAAPVNTGTAADEVWVWSFNDAVNGTNADQTVILA